MGRSLTFLGGVFVLSTSVLIAGTAKSQLPSWDAEQTAVWDFVRQSWVDDAAESDRWPAEYVHDKVVGWGDRAPAPRGKDEILAFERFQNDGGNVLYYEITPAAIVVEGDTAVVHYHLLIVTEDHAGERETSVEGLVEVLARQDDGWKFISLSGFTPKYDDGA